MIDQPRYVCALGAMQTVQGIHRGVPVLHAGPGCASKLAGGIAGSNGDSGYISPQIYPCTNVTDKEIVFGGENKLTSIIEHALQVIDGDLFVVLSGCTTEIVGDDIAKVVKKFDSREKPVIYVETAGFKGTNLQGHEWVINAIITQYLTKSAPERTIKGLVNIWGPIPSYDPFWIGNIRELESLVSELGLTPNTIFGENRGIDNINKIRSAEFNLLVSPWVGLTNMNLMKKYFDIPYLHYPVLPIGAVETGRFLRTLGKYAQVNPDIVEEVIKKHETEYYYYIERTSDIFLENRTMSRRFSTVTSATDALAISRFLVNDFGLVPDTQYITDGTPEEYQRQISNYTKRHN